MPGKEFQRELQSSQVECDRLQEENNRLRKLLKEHGIPIPAIQTQGRFGRHERGPGSISSMPRLNARLIPNPGACEFGVTVRGG